MVDPTPAENSDVQQTHTRQQPEQTWKYTYPWPKASLQTEAVQRACAEFGVGDRDGKDESKRELERFVNENGLGSSALGRKYGHMIDDEEVEKRLRRAGISRQATLLRI